jgi:crotonobetainyl-CoA:carnitine CoA-transferase CaiB-like acyl-CoA transferase
MKAACEGLTVVDFGQGMAGSMVGMILADHGADVIKVEPPTGDPTRATAGFLMWNRGKRSVVIDLKTQAGRAAAATLAASADVVVENFRPGVAERLGIGYEALARENPRLVYCSITAFGGGDARSARKVYEGVMAGISGRMVGLDLLSGATIGQDRSAPIYTAAPVASYGAAQLALQAVLAALLARRRTGRGERIETSLVAGEAAFLMRQDMPRGGADRAGLPVTPRALHRGIVLCFLVAETKDGRFIQMCARQDHHFRAWMDVLEMSEIFDDPIYAGAPLGIAEIADIVALEDRIRLKMAEKTQAEWMDAFVAGDVGADPFLEPDEFLEHPQMVETGRVVEIADPQLGIVREIGPLVLMSDTPACIERPSPALGADTREILAAVTSGAIRPAGATGASPGLDRLPHLLSGITIVELAYFVAGPLSTTLLAELGARVIKVEPLEGDPSRRTGLQNAKFLLGKDSIAVDLKSEAGQKILRELLERSDALLHNFRPGVPGRLGFGYELAHEINPRLVYVYGASYGSTGPWKRRSAFHSTPNALCGGGILQAGEGNPPADDSYADPGSGLAAATALLLGLWARENTGEGQYLETSMLTSAGYIHSNDLVFHAGASPRLVPDHGQHGLHALYRMYPAASDWVFLAGVTEEDWAAAARTLGHAEWVDDPRFGSAAARLEHDDELVELIAGVVRERDAAAWEADLVAADVAATRITDVPLEEWFEREGTLIPENHPLFGPFWRPPVKSSASGYTPYLGSVAANGEHTRTILRELGYDDDQVDQMRDDGVIVEWQGSSDS